MCLFIFPAPQNVWSHFVFTWKVSIQAEDLKIFHNGVEVAEFFYRRCENKNTAIGSGNDYMFLGGTDELSLSPYVAFDDVIIWYEILSPNDVKNMYRYYKG